jgi:hypothetical protein
MFRRILALAGILSCALIAPCADALEPAVEFVGGNVMYAWANSGYFSNPEGSSPTYPIFLNDSFQVAGGAGICHETRQAQLVVNQLLANTEQLAPIHLVVGAGDVEGTSDSNPPSVVFTNFQTCYTDLVDSILNAGRKVILGTIPYTLFNDPTPYNEFIMNLAAEKGVPVINYYGMLRHANNNFEGTQYFIPASGSMGPSITPAGYQLMNQQAAAVLDQLVSGVTFKSGYLGVDSLVMAGDPPFKPKSGLNTVPPNTKMHWQAWLTYSDGKTIPQGDPNIAGLLGTWTSSNPSVVYIDPYGTAWALQPGTANIHFTTLGGAEINEWIMTVIADNGPY